LVKKRAISSDFTKVRGAKNEAFAGWLPQFWADKRPYFRPKSGKISNIVDEMSVFGFCRDCLNCQFFWTKTAVFGPKSALLDPDLAPFMGGKKHKIL
jgi:hypothetical protein